MKFEEKIYTRADDEITYFSNFELPTQNPVILYLHCLFGDKEWFPAQYSKYGLNNYDWVVPDLLGYGHSSQIEEKQRYTIDYQANLLVQLIFELKIQNLILIGHSLGGPVALAIAEKIQQANLKSTSNVINIVAIFQMEGNIDAGDTTFSSKFANLTFDQATALYNQENEKLKQEILDTPEKKEEINYSECNSAFVIWATCVDLVRLSASDTILPRLMTLDGIPLRFIYGKKNKGKLSQEQKIREHNLPHYFVPGADHGMLEANPEGLWRIIFREIQLILKTN